MAWKQQLTDALADILRFTIRGSVLIGVIACSVAFAYVLTKICYFSVRYLNDTLFSKPW